MESRGVNNDLGYLAEQLSKQSAEDAAWVFFVVAAYSKMKEER